MTPTILARAFIVNKYNFWRTQGVGRTGEDSQQAPGW